MFSLLKKNPKISISYFVIQVWVWWATPDPSIQSSSCTPPRGLWRGRSGPRAWGSSPFPEACLFYHFVYSIIFFVLKSVMLKWIKSKTNFFVVINFNQIWLFYIIRKKWFKNTLLCFNYSIIRLYLFRLMCKGSAGLLTKVLYFFTLKLG